MPGSKYEATKDLDIKEVAKLVRADIKAAIKAGKLPEGKYGVRIQRYSGGQSMDVTMKDLDLVPYRKNEEGIQLYTEEAVRVRDLVDAIMDQYNFDNSDPMTDYFHVRFYGRADFDWQWARAKTEEVRAGNSLILGE